MTTPTINQQQSTQDLGGGLSAQTVTNTATTESAQKDAEQKQTETSSQSNQSTQTAKTINNFMLLVKPSLVQPNVFPDLNIGQELPNDIKMMQNIYMDLITNGSLFNPDQSDKLKSIASDAVELEQ
jgi:hypothetical protein